MVPVSGGMKSCTALCLGRCDWGALWEWCSSASGVCGVVCECVRSRGARARWSDRGAGRSGNAM